MTRSPQASGWTTAGWLGVAAGLLDTATPLLHPAPAAAIPMGVTAYGLLGVALFLLLESLQRLAAAAFPRLRGGPALSLAGVSGLLTGFFGLYLVTTSTSALVASRRGQAVGLLLAVVLAGAAAALTFRLARRVTSPGGVRRAGAATPVLIAIMLVYPVLGALHGLRDGAFDPADGPPPRGLVLVSLDAMRGDRVGALGYPRPTTPNLDRLVAGGVAFSRAYVEIPASAPGHASMLTGLPPLCHGVLANTHILDDAVITLAERLRDEGFATAALLNNYYLESRFGFDQGFDLFIDRYRATHLRGQDPRHLLRGLALFHAWARLFRAPGAPNDDTIEGALAWLRHRPAGDFFLFLHIMDPHSPYDPPPDLRERFYTPAGEPVRDTEELRARMDSLSAREIAALRDLYDADVALGDRKLGRLVDELARLGLLESTLIVVTADHGEVLYERGRTFDHGLVWNGNLHVPLVMSCPARLPAGLVASHPVSATALVPTACAVLGVPYVEQADPPFHASLLDAEGRPLPPAPPVRVQALTGVTDADAAAVMDGRLKLIVRRGAIDGLYDLVEDPAEQADLWPELQADPTRSDLTRRVWDLERSLAEWLARTREASVVAGPRAEASLDPDTRARLRALGYVD